MMMLAVSLLVAGAACGEICVDRNVVFSNTRCTFEMTSSCSDHVQIMVEASAIVNDASAIFGTFPSYFGMSFLVVGAIFGDVGG